MISFFAEINKDMTTECLVDFPGTLAAAQAKLKEAEETSNLDTDQSSGKRSRHVRKRKAISESESDEEPDSLMTYHLPQPPMPASLVPSSMFNI